MAYTDKEFYRDIYIGSIDATDDEINRLLERGSEYIDHQTYNRIILNEFDNLSPFQQDMIKRANSAYVEYALNNQEFENVSPVNTAFSLGDLSMGGVTNARDFNASTKPVRCLNFLNRTGLTYKGIVAEGYFDEFDII